MTSTGHHDSVQFKHFAVTGVLFRDTSQCFNFLEGSRLLRLSWRGKCLPFKPVFMAGKCIQKSSKERASAQKAEAFLPGVNSMKSSYLVCLLAVGVVGCSSTSTTMVKVPPRMTLDPNKTIGIVRFDVEGGRGEERNATAKFMEAIQHGQPGVPIVELGSSSEVLNGVGKSQLNGEAVQEIGKKYNVDAVIVGTVQLKESQPKVNVNIAQGLSLS